MRVDAVDVAVDDFVAVDPALFDAMLISLDPVDPALFDLGPIAYDELQPVDLAIDPATDTPSDVQTFGGPDGIGPILYDVDPAELVDGGWRSSFGLDELFLFDLMPEWRTLAGEDGSDSVHVLYMQMDSGSTGEAPSSFDPGTETPGDVIYTLETDDALIFTTMALDHAPGRSPDPLPYERTSSAPATAPEPEIDRTPVHYAASEAFHTGLDLL